MIAYRDGSPAINVKDRHLWARDPRCARAYAELPEATIEAVYEGVREDFWQDIAAEHGYRTDRNGQRVYAAGRSGGWLILACPPDLSELSPNLTNYYLRELPRWEAFAADIRAAVQAAGEMFVSRLSDELAELEAAREACIIRSEN